MPRASSTAAALAEAVFLLGYPLVLTDRMRARATAVDAVEPRTLRAPVNQLVHARGTPDTLESSAWLDLAGEPVVLSVPDTQGRYYVLWLRDAWNTVFASVGARTTGTATGAFALLGPAARGVRLPPGLTPIVAPTRTVHLGGCVEAVGERDEPALRWARDGFTLAPLSGPASPAAGSGAPPDPATPVEQVERMDAREFLAEVERLAVDNPPAPADRALIDELLACAARPGARAAIERGMEQARAAVRAAAQRPAGEPVGCWRVGYRFGALDEDRLRRAGAARAGVGADPATDALQALVERDAEGLPLTGSHRYQLRFAPDAPPPVHGFWSLTARDRTPGNAHSIGDLRGLALDADGSLPIHIQHARPARLRQSNWLPAPAGDFTIELDLYWPAAAALQRDWAPPAILRVG